MTKAKKVTKPDYRATLLIAGRRVSANGASVSEAIANLKPGIVKGKAVLTLENIGTKATKDRVIPAPYLSRLFNLSPMMREIALKQISGLYGV